MDTKQLSQISAKAVNKQDLTTGKGGGLTRGNKVFLKKKPQICGIVSKMKQ